MIGQDDLGAVADEERAIDLDAHVAQPADFLEEGDRIEHDAVADHAVAARAQHAAGNQLQDELLAVDDDRVPGIVSAGIARHDREAFRQHVDDLALALVSPLRANDDRSFTLVHEPAPSLQSIRTPGVRTHTLRPRFVAVMKIAGI